MSLYLGENLISGQATLVGESRNIGQIIPSTIPLTDAGLHLLDGALIQGDGIYSAFVTYIAGLVSTYPNLFITESDWQTAVTTYGVCGKFVYDEAANTVRLPKITGIIEGTTDVNALGDLVEAGIPNITGTIYNNSSAAGDQWSDTTNVISTGALSPIRASINRYAMSNAGSSYSNLWDGIAFNASNISSVYNNSTTVQPQTIKVLYYIVVATSTKTDIEVDIDEIVTDLNGKADVDLSNISDTAKIAIAHNAMPSGTYEDLTVGASDTEYIAPADGWFMVHVTEKASGYVNLYIEDGTTGESKYTITCHGTNTYYNQGDIAPVTKGDVCRLNYNDTLTFMQFRFIYAVGSESEAS